MRGFVINFLNILRLKTKTDSNKFEKKTSKICGNLEIIKKSYSSANGKMGDEKKNCVTFVYFWRLVDKPLIRHRFTCEAEHEGAQDPEDAGYVLTI